MRLSMGLAVAIALAGCGASEPTRGGARTEHEAPEALPPSEGSSGERADETQAEAPEVVLGEEADTAPPDAETGRASLDIACASDAECGWNHPCVPTRCVAAQATPGDAVCDETAPPPGTCECLGRRCTLRPSTLRPSTPAPVVSCSSFCAVDPTRGVCAPFETGGGVLPDGLVRAGAACTCDGPAGEATCTYRIHEPVPCRSALDCDVGSEGGAPFPARARPRRRRAFRPCEDGEWAPTCVEGECRLVGFGC